MTGEVLIESGYEEICKYHDRISYEKEVSKEPLKIYKVRYIDGEWEYMLIEKKERYWSHKEINGLSYPYTIEEIEEILWKM